MHFKLLAMLFICLAGMSVQAQTMEKPKVLIITTGGTIASQTNASSLEGHELVRAVPELLQYAEIEVHEFVRIGSSKMTPAIWLELVKFIHQILSERSDLSCIVITHGTDTMEETAFFLNLTHRHKTPIVVVGSMRASNEISPDGPINLINAVRAGISNDAVGRGVMVVMNDNISAARDLIKTNNRRVDAFPATEYGYMGFIDPEKVTFYRKPFKPHTINSSFDVYAHDTLPAVDIVMDFAGADPELLSYYLERNNNGIVVASFAGGRMSNAMAGVNDLKPDTKPVVVASSIKNGRIMGSTSNYRGAPVVVANDLPPNKARILLMLALTRTDDPQKIQEMFDTY